MKRPNTPFPRHWLYYVTLKIILLIAAITLAVYVGGLVWPP